MPTADLDTAAAHHLKRQLNLRDLVLSQILTVVGSSWVGLAAGLGHAQTVVWLFAFAVFYAPMAVAVFYLNREMPLEGGLYVWARRSFGDTLGFLTAWNIWAYGLFVIAFLLFQLPSEFAFMVGPSAAWIPDNHAVVLTSLAVLLTLLTLSALRGLALGKWIHNVSGTAMMIAFALLIAAPFWAYAHHLPIHFTPFELHLPHTDPTSLALIGQIIFAASGLEYIAIMAGEAKSPSRDIGLSIIIASPIIVVMFILGTASVLAFHELMHSTINYIAPIPQTLRLAFGDSSTATLLARFVILLLQIRILGAASYIFAGVARLPMAAGWDHLIPAWFSRLHPRYRTPVNSILFAATIIAALIVLGSAGVHAAEAFNVLNNASTEFYVLAYLVLFAIPIALVLMRKPGAPRLASETWVSQDAIGNRIPLWAVLLCAVGFLSVLFTFGLNAYPFDTAASPLPFAAKILGTVLLINLLGYTFYKLRNTRPSS
ncbi:amino acid permease [Granulicella sp. 5B5]|uniref:APC family permease n=1 Tax=Granulicella sp. 5B5 TaxID=1617967 RepID=UPI0015F3A093|nr:APC family permease [Granulicella sp. 5B5]QMV18032.1 amino acid permease [Granulicella sp. 5B5]